MEKILSENQANIFEEMSESRTRDNNINTPNITLVSKKPLISGHDHKYEHLNFLYRYPISYKIAKKANPEKRICPFSKMISQPIETLSK